MYNQIMEYNTALAPDAPALTVTPWSLNCVTPNNN